LSRTEIQHNGITGKDILEDPSPQKSNGKDVQALPTQKFVHFFGLNYKELVLDPPDPSLQHNQQLEQILSAYVRYSFLYLS
jgi:hypothetical protein